MSDYWSEFTIFATAHILSLISPGPDFMMVVRSSLRYSRKKAFMVAIGIGLGEIVHISYSLLLIDLLVDHANTVFTVLKYFGAAYLIYFGITSLRSKEETIGEDIYNIINNESNISNKSAIMKGFLTNALNAKAGFFNFSFFSVLVSSSTPMSIKLVYAGFIEFSTLAWFLIVTLFLTNKSVHKKFYGVKHWIDRLCGLVLIFLAIELIFAKF